MERFESVSNTAMDYVNQLVHSAAHTSRMFESACAAAHPHLNKAQAVLLAAAAKRSGGSNQQTGGDNNVVCLSRRGCHSQM